MLVVGKMRNQPLCWTVILCAKVQIDLQEAEGNLERSRRVWLLPVVETQQVADFELLPIRPDDSGFLKTIAAAIRRFETLRNTHVTTCATVVLRSSRSRAIARSEDENDRLRVGSRSGRAAARRTVPALAPAPSSRPNGLEATARSSPLVSPPMA